MAILLAAALMMQGPAEPPRIEVGIANWAAFREIEPRVSLPTDNMVDRVEEILASGQCRLTGQTSRRFNIDVRYAIHFDAGASAERVVVQDLSCRPLEALVGQIVRLMLREQQFALPAERAEGWYTNRIVFALES